MKLYEVPRNTMVRVVREDITPPAAPLLPNGTVVKFHNVDGMYSYCTDQAGDPVHLAAWAEVEIVE